MSETKEEEGSVHEYHELIISRVGRLVARCIRILGVPHNFERTTELKYTTLKLMGRVIWYIMMLSLGATIVPDLFNIVLLEPGQPLTTGLVFGTVLALIYVWMFLELPYVILIDIIESDETIRYPYRLGTVFAFMVLMFSVLTGVKIYPDSGIYSGGTFLLIVVISKIYDFAKAKAEGK